MKLYLWLALCCACMIVSCGGGTMGSPAAAVSPNTLAFGTEVVGSMSQTLDITLTNSGTATLQITSITATANFSQTNTCSTTLAASKSCTITVTFIPTASGSLAGSIGVTDNASGSPQTVSLTGSGTTITGNRCSNKGQQCSSGAPPLPPACCGTLTCTPASTRAFCE